jgi:ABC-type antimicrobial peptide transport system permease subunit
VRINSSRWATIIGVVGDVRHSGLENAPEPTVYVQNGEVDSVAIRTVDSPNAVISSIRQTIRNFDAGGLVTDILTMSQYVDQAEAPRKFQTMTLTAFAGIALFLVLVGLFGLLSFMVEQRTLEIGIRMVMGASPRSVIRMVVYYGLRLTSAGLIIGVLAAMLLARAMTSFIYGVRAIDPLTFLFVPVFLIVAAVIACSIPARKAARTDPMTALRRQ